MEFEMAADDEDGLYLDLEEDLLSSRVQKKRGGGRGLVQCEMCDGWWHAQCTQNCASLKQGTLCALFAALTSGITSLLRLLFYILCYCISKRISHCISKPI